MYYNEHLDGVYVVLCTYSCLNGALSTKAVISTVENVRGGVGQDLATEVIHVGLNQPPVFFFYSVKHF